MRLLVSTTFRIHISSVLPILIEHFGAKIGKIQTESPYSTTFGRILFSGGVGGREGKDLSATRYGTFCCCRLPPLWSTSPVWLLLWLLLLRIKAARGDGSKVEEGKSCSVQPSASTIASCEQCAN